MSSDTSHARPSGTPLMTYGIYSLQRAQAGVCLGAYARPWGSPVGGKGAGYE